MRGDGCDGGGTLDELQALMGYRFRSIELLKLALTHPSVFAQTNTPKPPNPPDNQRLEFLGDAVVQLCVSEALYRRYPDMREGDMTNARIAFVRKESLSQAAAALRLDRHLVIGAAERGHGLSGRTSVMCDAFEAVAAAVYLDGGFDEARGFVSRSLNDYALRAKTAAVSNWKSRLQELMQAAGQRAPRYSLTDVSGPPHAPEFTAEVHIGGGVVLGRGKGSSRKAAEQEAARAAARMFETAARELSETLDKSVETPEDVIAAQET
ncbi:MAG: ribonuclease III [Oscillospiraceae bacterium]|jgi:ribonuclease-3|nr:ribonuclease III [Oscillospiraceae bacterium]